jgi:hypothetical protein
VSSEVDASQTRTSGYYNTVTFCLLLVSSSTVSAYSGSSGQQLEPCRYSHIYIPNDCFAQQDFGYLINIEYFCIRMEMFQIKYVSCVRQQNTEKCNIFWGRQTPILLDSDTRQRSPAPPSGGSETDSSVVT